MKKFKILLFCCVLGFLSNPAFASSTDDRLISLLDSFAKAYQELKIPEFDYSYENNFQTIQDASGILKQRNLFEEYKAKLNTVDRARLSNGIRFLYDLFQYEIQFNLERVALELDFRLHPVQIPTDGLHRLPSYHKWYQLYIKRWSARTITPNELVLLGHREIEKVQLHIKAIQKKLGYEGDNAGFYNHLNSDAFFVTNLETALNLYKQKQASIFAQLPKLFLVSDIKPVDIKPIPDANENTPPGYYTEETFFLNFYGNKHNIRSMDWLFMHEAIPGHHYQHAVSKQTTLPASEFRKLFWYPGHAEGWAAYVEHFGEELGLYNDDYDWLGKWEWDLVRSARLVLDVGIHDLGWTDEKALKFWRENIQNQDHIAAREIARIRRWPGQVVSYKVGEDEIFKIRDAISKQNQSSFDIRQFHHLVVKNGSMPLPALQNSVYEAFQKRP